MPPLEDVLNAPAAQALPYIFHTVMGTPGGGLALMFFILGVAVFCCISITTAASRTTWAFARDQAIPFSSVWSKLSTSDQVPVMALALLTVVQMLLGLINLGSTSAFTAFASCGVIALAAGYAIPIGISLFTGRKAVATARWRCPGPLGWIVNALSVAWIAFQLVLFSMPAALPVTVVTMNYASVVFVGFMAISAVYYIVYGHRGEFLDVMSVVRTFADSVLVYKGPPDSDGL
jgi:amino acid transporter